MTSDERRERDGKNAEVTPPLRIREARTTRWETTNPTGPRDWLPQANCYLTHGKYHLTPQNQQHAAHIQHAANLCKTCPVINQCHNYIMSLPPDHRYGIWAGTQYADPFSPTIRTRQRTKKLI